MTHDSPTFDTQLNRLTDEARRENSAQERLHRSDRALAAALSGTFAGTLIDLAETRAPISVLTRTGNSIRGTVAALGPDVVVLSPASGTNRVLLRRLAIEAIIEQGPGHDRDQSITTGPELAELIDDYSVENGRLALTMSTGNTLMGEVQFVGADQVVLRRDGDASTVTVPLHAIDQVVLA